MARIKNQICSNFQWELVVSPCLKCTILFVVVFQDEGSSFSSLQFKTFNTVPHSFRFSRKMPFLKAFIHRSWLQSWNHWTKCNVRWWKISKICKSSDRLFSRAPHMQSLYIYLDFLHSLPNHLCRILEVEVGYRFKFFSTVHNFTTPIGLIF